jgi:hypothetical protein
VHTRPGGRAVAFDIEIHLVDAACKDPIIRGGHRTDAGQYGESGGDAAARRYAFALLVSALVGVKREGNQALFCEAQVDRSHLSEGACEEAGANHEPQAERQLNDDHGLSETHLSPAGTGGALGFDDIGQVHPVQLEDGRHGKERRGEEANRKGEKQHTPIERRIDELARAGRDEKTRRGPSEHACEQNPGGSAHGGEQQILRHNLPHYAHAARAQSKADGELAAPRSGAGDEQSRKIDAGDKQYEGGNRHELYKESFLSAHLVHHSAGSGKEIETISQEFLAPGEG